MTLRFAERTDLRLLMRRCLHSVLPLRAAAAILLGAGWAGDTSVADNIGVDPTPTASPSTTTTTAPAVSPTSPADAEAGAFETPLGLVEWRHVTGDRETLPYPDLGVVQTALGYSAMGSGSNPDAESIEGYQYWTSADGYEWTRSPLPVPVEARGARLKAVGDAVWLITVGPDSLWRSEDGESWLELPVPPGAGPWGSVDDLELHHVDGSVWLINGVPPGAWVLDGATWTHVDTSEITPPAITGATWRLRNLAAPVSLPGATVIPWHLTLDVDWASLLGVDPSPRPYSVWNEGSATMEVWGNYGGGAMATLEVEQVGTRLLFTDPASAAILLEIAVDDPRIDPATLLEDALSVGEYSLVVVDEQGAVTQSRPPWGEPDAIWAKPGQASATLFADDELVALITTLDGAQTWTSPDGLDWSGPQTHEFNENAEGLQAFSHVEGDTVFVEVFGDDGKTVWMSADATSWTATGLGGPEVSHFVPLRSGGIYYSPWEFGQGDLAASADLHRWELIDPGELRMFDAKVMGVHTAFTTGDTVFFAHGHRAFRELYVWKLAG